jgi:hypothetical protein
LRKRYIQVQEALRTPNIHNPNRNSTWHIIVKTLSVEKKERLLMASRENHQITIRITDISIETLKTGKAWNEVLQIL